MNNARKNYFLHFEESIKKMMIADVEIGCFLSGGIDSSFGSFINAEKF